MVISGICDRVCKLQLVNCTLLFDHEQMDYRLKHSSQDSGVNPSLE
jgi:hypothetical protein